MGVSSMVCKCGEHLLASVGQETITTIEGRSLVFRRRSDYLLCPSCLRLYSVTQLHDVVSELEPMDSELVDLGIVLGADEDRVPLEDQFG